MKKYKHVASKMAKDYEKVEGVSMTVPDQSLTVREIMLKYANGTLNEIEHEKVYVEQGEDLRGYDMCEIYNMAKENGELIMEAKKKLSTKKKKEEFDKLVEEEVQKILIQKDNGLG